MRRYFPATIRPTGEGVEVTDPDIDLRDLICGAPDLNRVLEWAEINGVRRIVEMRFSSDVANEELGFDVEMVRTFTYLPTDPFDLVRIEDQVVSV